MSAIEAPSPWDFAPALPAKAHRWTGFCRPLSNLALPLVASEKEITDKGDAEGLLPPKSDWEGSCFSPKPPAKVWVSPRSFG